MPHAFRAWGISNKMSVQDSLVFFVGIDKQAGTEIWKMIFTGFEAADGKFVFDKQKLVAANCYKLSC